MKAKSTIKVIIFDFFGVVITGTYRDTAKWLGEKYKISPRKVLDVLYFKYFNQAAEGKITEAQMFRRAMAELGIHEQWWKIKQKHLSFLVVNKPMLDYARLLQRQGYTVLFLSKNTPTQLMQILRKYNIKKHIRYIINTYDLRLPKTSIKTIRYILKRFKVKPQEVIMIDDQDFNLIAPQKLGVHAVLYRSRSQAMRLTNALLKRYG